MSRSDAAGSAGTTTATRNACRLSPCSAIWCTSGVPPYVASSDATATNSPCDSLITLFRRSTYS